MIPYCIERIQSDDRHLQEGVCFVLCNILYYGTPHQMLAVLSCTNSLGAICTLLRNDESISLIKKIMKALNRCLDLGNDLQRQQHSCTNEVRVLMDACGCLNAVKDLTIDDDDVRNMVDAFISKSNRYDNICDSGMKIQNSSVIEMSDRKRDDSTSKRVAKMVICNENQLIELLRNEDIKKRVTELVICEGCGNEMRNDLELCGFENLERIIVKNNSLRSLNSLSICDNPVLKRIESKNEMNDDGPTFENVKSVTITSTLIVELLT